MTLIDAEEIGFPLSSLELMQINYENLKFEKSDCGSSLCLEAKCDGNGA